VWQRVWSNDLRSVIESDSTFHSLHLLTHQIEPDGSVISIAIDQEFLSSDSNHSFTAVIRISSGAPDSIWDTLSLLIDSLQSNSELQWDGIEIDYDCAESKLSKYAADLRELRTVLPEDWQLSITALPTWCNSKDLTDLVQAVDYSVLQVHSVDNPRDGLFNSVKAERWIRRYSALTDHPFYTAIPCYGSKVYFNDNGSVAGVESESPRSDILWLPSEEFTVDPLSVDSFLDVIEEEPIPWLQGYLWFRLPTERDWRSWDKESLDAVINREVIESHLTLVLTESNGTVDISVRNEGYGNADIPTVIVNGHTLFSDPLTGYGRRFDSRKTIFYPVSSRKLTFGEELSVGWFRGDSTLTVRIKNEVTDE